MTVLYHPTPFTNRFPLLSSLNPSSKISSNIGSVRKKTAGLWYRCPGIVTLNDTKSYTWPDFGQRAKELVQNVFQSYPKPEELRITSLLLRYIDAVEFDYNNSNVFAFLEEKLKTKITLLPKLFNDVPVTGMPVGFNFQAVFPVTLPKGAITVRFATGTSREKPVLIWETAVHSRGNDVPKMPEKFEEWVEDAHRLTDDWFFKLIEGELERRFASE